MIGSVENTELRTIKGLDAHATDCFFRADPTQLSIDNCACPSFREKHMA